MTQYGREKAPSGRFVLRIPPPLHAALRKTARELGMSLNDYCARKLAAPLGHLSTFEGAARVVEQATELFGDHLTGIIAFGSWTRGEATAASDIDLLIVLDDHVALTRDLYRQWDQAPPVKWGGRIVEPHFAHLPARDETVAGIWAEAAVDGVVVFETGLRVSIRLAQVRRDIVAGRIVRRSVHGHPYWKVA